MAATGTVSSVNITGAPAETITGEQVGKPGPTLSATANLASGTGEPTFEWTSDNENAVTVDSDGKLSYVGNGTAHITATASFPAGSGENDKNYGTVTVTTENLKGSDTDPYTCDEAMNMIDDGSLAESYKKNVCVSGIVSQIVLI